MDDKNNVSYAEQRKIDEEIYKKSEVFRYQIFDYTLRDLTSKLEKRRLFVPDYQRRFVWREDKQCCFIESLFMGLPIPSIFLGRSQRNGSYEIIDGVQRLSSIKNFVEGRLKLEGLKKIVSLNDRTFDQLSDETRENFLDKSLRTIVLFNKLKEEPIKELFKRVNTTSEKLSEFETIREVFKGKSSLIDLIEEFEQAQTFIAVTPLSKQRLARYRGERGYFLLRFFVFLDNYAEVGQRPFDYLYNFMEDRASKLKRKDINRYRKTLDDVLNFVGKYFGANGFGKSKNLTTRTQFDALAIGVALALRENPSLKCSTEAVEKIRASKEFQELTPSGASSNSGKLSKRIEFVRDKLLEVSRGL